MIKIKKLLLPFLGLVIFTFFSTAVALTTAPTITGLSAAFKRYVSLPKPIVIADLIAAYKNFVSPAAKTTPAP